MMQLNWQNWWFSIFTKLLALFFIMILPVYAMAIHSNESGSHLVSNEISSSLQAQISFYHNSLNKEIDRMIQLQRQYVVDDDLLNLSVIGEGLPDYDRSLMMRQLQLKLNLIKSSGIYATVAKAYIPSLQRIISTDDLTTTLPSGQIEQLKKERELFTNGTPIYARDGKLFIREFYPTKAVTPERDPVFVLETEISVNELRNFLLQISSFKKSGSALVSDAWRISSDENNEAMTPIIERVQSQVAKQLVNGRWIENIRVNNQNYITAFEYASDSNTTLLVFVPESDILGPLQKYKKFILLMSIATIVLIVLVSYWIYQVIHKPLSKMVRAFRNMESGNLNLVLHHKSRDEFNYLYRQFNRMADRLRTLIYEVYEKQLQKQQAELNQLQSQIKPHFLYNSLYLLYRITKDEDYENSLRLTKYLGDYFRYITKVAGEDVPLSEEWHHVRVYMEIQNVRFSNRLKVSIAELPEDKHNLLVPRLILQPLVENAYNYGLEHTLVNGELTITVEAGEKVLRILIEDNGIGMTEEDIKLWNHRFTNPTGNIDVSGMMNVHRRLQLKFGDESGIQVRPRSGGGLCVILTIRIDKEEGNPC